MKVAARRQTAVLKWFALSAEKPLRNSRSELNVLDSHLRPK
jgi:hypothetical protein